MKNVWIMIVSVLIPLTAAKAQKPGVEGVGTAGTVFVVSKDQPVDAGLTRSLAIEIRVQDSGVKTMYVNALEKTATVKRIGLKDGTGQRDLWLMNDDRNPPEDDIVCWIYDETVQALKLNFHGTTLGSQPTVTLEVLDKKGQTVTDELSMVLETNTNSRLMIKRENQ